MEQLSALYATVLAHGTRKKNRTGVPTIGLDGAAMFFDASTTFPAVTTKKLAFKSVCAEAIAFLQGKTSAKDFRDLGTTIWDANANEHTYWLANPCRLGQDDLGPVYGSQWRHWNAFKIIEITKGAQIKKALQDGYAQLALVKHPKTNKDAIIVHKTIDQILYVLEQLIHNPENRRILFHGWNWAELDQMALPPCHLLYQLLPNPDQKTLSLCLYVRSNDLGLGAPFNIAEAALFLNIFARFTGYRPHRISYFIGDAHIYENHLDMITTQMGREPYPSPTLVIDNNVPSFNPQYPPSSELLRQWLNQLHPSQFSLRNYQHHPALSAPMAV